MDVQEKYGWRKDVSSILALLFLVAIVIAALWDADSIDFLLLFIYLMLCWYGNGVVRTCPFCKAWRSGTFHSMESTSDNVYPLVREKYKCKKCGHEWFGEWSGCI